MNLNYGLTNDYFFKKLFSQPKYFKILIKYIVGLDLEPEVIETTTTELIASAKMKGERYDIRVKFRDPIIGSEDQTDKQEFKQARLEAHHTRKIHYASQLLATLYGRDTDYIIIIYLINDDIGGENAIQVSQFTNIQTKKVSDVIKIYDVCLKKGKKCDSLEAEEFFDVLRTKELKDYQTPIARELMELITDWSVDERGSMQVMLEENYERELATDRFLLKKEGIQEGLEQGIEQGAANTKKEMVLAMLENQLSKELISEITKLTLEQIEEIIQSQNN